MRKHFIDNIELYLSAAGVLVVLLSTALVQPGTTDVWFVAAVTALAVSVLHGVIFWVVRRRQRLIRESSIHDIREMLRDRVKNQLAVAKMWLPEEGRAEYEVHFDGIAEAIEAIDRQVDGLSEEALRAWKLDYANAQEHYAFA